LTVAFPVPNAFAVIVIQPALLVAFHVQFELAVTATLPLVAAEVGKVADNGEMVGVHWALKAKVADRTLGRISRGPTTLTTASYTTPTESGVVSSATKST